MKKTIEKWAVVWLGKENGAAVVFSYEEAKRKLEEIKRNKYDKVEIFKV